MNPNYVFQTSFLENVYLYDEDGSQVSKVCTDGLIYSLFYDYVVVTLLNSKNNFKGWMHLIGKYQTFLLTYLIILRCSS